MWTKLPLMMMSIITQKSFPVPSKIIAPLVTSTIYKSKQKIKHLTRKFDKKEEKNGL